MLTVTGWSNKIKVVSIIFKCWLRLHVEIYSVGCEEWEFMRVRIISVSWQVQVYLVEFSVLISVDINVDINLTVFSIFWWISAPWVISTLFSNFLCPMLIPWIELIKASVYCKLILPILCGFFCADMVRHVMTCVRFRLLKCCSASFIFQLCLCLGLISFSDGYVSVVVKFHFFELDSNLFDDSCP